MSRSRLPQPPLSSRGSARPLPPEPPSGGGSEDVPPPLPSRPAPHRGGHIPPPPIQNGSPHVEEIPPDDYLEPDDWCGDGPEPPRLPPRNFSPTLSSEDTYEEPEANLPLPPPSAPAHEGGEIYDDLEDEQQQPELQQQNGLTQDEVYDQCDVQPLENEENEPELYQVPDEIPAPSLPPPVAKPEPEPEEDSGLYEFVPENKVETNVRNVPPPPINNPPSRSQMPVPGIPQPPLPKRPTPQKERPPSPDDDGAPVLPGRPGAGGAKPPNKRQLSGDGPVMPAFSSELIGNKIAQLKKVNSKDKPETEDKADMAETDMLEADSVRNRILKFKQQANTGTRPPISSKPFLPVKPTVSTVKSSPSVEKTTKQEPKMEEPPPPPPPPPAQERAQAQAHVKMPPPPPETQFESDDVYDDGMSYIRDPMTQHEWYHGEIERSESDGRLKHIGQDGTFLVRKSRQGGKNQPYTLVVLYQNHVYNLKIRTRDDEQVALGEVKPDEMTFKDVPALISHHRTNDVILVNKTEQKQYTTLLKKFPVAINR